MDKEQAGKHLQEQYSRRFSAREHYRNSLWEILCNSFFQRLIPADSVVLDLGCGWGEFINHIQATKKLAMDLNPDSQSHLSDDIEFIHHDCSQSWPAVSSGVDVIFSSNFLEHLADKQSVENTIEHAYRALKPGGKLICMGPNVRLVPGAYWDFWDHHVAISDHSLTELLQLKGFTVIESTAHFLPYTMSGGKQAPLALVKVYLRLRWAWRFFGKQFLIVARKAA